MKDILDPLIASPLRDIYAWGLGLFGLAMLAEWMWSRKYRPGLYDPADTFANLSLYAGYFLINLLWVPVLLRIYLWASDHAVLQLWTPGWTLGSTSLRWEWLLLIVAEDFCFYWFHRTSHHVGWLWASHVTHHSSQHFNLSVALRQTWVPMTAMIFWLPLVLLGFDPLMVLFAQAASLFYQSWLHTQIPLNLGPLEWILNTPRHHKLHHGGNSPYLNRNFGGVMIIWDRLFGSFARESAEPVRFGIGTDRPVNNPFHAAFDEWVHWFRRTLGPAQTEQAGGH